MGNQGVSGRGTSPGFSHPSCKERNKAATSNLKATKKVSDNENVRHRQIYASPPLAGCGVTLGFRFSIDTFSPRPPPFQVIWRWFSQTLFIRPPFFPFLLGVPCRLRNLAVQRCGSGCLRSRVFDTCSGSWNRGIHEFSHISAYTAHQSGLVQRYCLGNP